MEAKEGLDDQGFRIGGQGATPRTGDIQMAAILLENGDYSSILLGPMAMWPERQVNPCIDKNLLLIKLH